MHARNLEFYRDKSALGWSILLPVLLVFGFAFMFSGEGKPEYRIGILGDKDEVLKIAPKLAKLKFVKFVYLKTQTQAIDKLRHHHYDMIINLPQKKYWINSSSRKGYFLETIVKANTAEIEISPSVIQGDEIRYVDWVAPGILAMNIMFNCLFGVGYTVVHYRKNGVLKRLRATPVSAMEFLSAQVSSRLLVIGSITILVYLGCDLFIGFLMLGSHLSLFFVLMLGAVCVIALGLIVASRTKSEEFSNGVLNLISWPMMLLSGVWFSLEGTPEFIQTFSNFLPLTHVVEASRAIMNDGATLFEVKYNLICLVFMSLLFLIIGTKLFRWE